MTEVKFVTDKEIIEIIMKAILRAANPKIPVSPTEYAVDVRALVARIEADQAEIIDARIRLNERRKIIAEQDAEIARLKAEATPLREAIGLLTTLHPKMVVDPENPVGMAQEIHAHVTATEARLKAEVERMSEPVCTGCGGTGRITSDFCGARFNGPCPDCTGRAR